MPRAISAGGPSQQGTPTTQDRPRRTDQGAQDLPREWGLGAGWEGHGQKDGSATLQGAPPPSVGLWGVGGGEGFLLRPSDWGGGQRPRGGAARRPRGLGTRAALWDRGQWVAAGVRSQGWGRGAGSREGVRASSAPVRPWLPSAKGHSALGVGGDWRPYSGPTMELCLLATEVKEGAPCFWPIGPHSLASLPAVQTLGSPGEGEGWEVQAPGPPRRWWLHGTPRRRGRGRLEPEGTDAEDPGCLGKRIEGLRVGLADPRGENSPLWG